MNTFKTLVLFLIPGFLFPVLRLSGQITDNFSDGNLTGNPAWQGDITAFTVNGAGELQLNAPDAGTSVLSVAGNIPDSAVWLLAVRLEFAPSATNLLRVYLLADQSDLLMTNGYYLEIGENGTADALRFYRQDGPARTLLATGLPGFVANEPVDFRLRVKRTATGIWSMEAATGNGAFQAQGGAADAMYAGGGNRYFGLYCLYTATRKDKFFFDDLSILPDLPDKVPPVLLNALADNATTVSAVFDEALDSLSALDPAHYSIAGVGQVLSATFGGNDRQTVLLTLPSPLSTGNYNLVADQIADTSGNAGGVQTAAFSFIKVDNAREFDILINEIMADPSPSAGLPEVEWLELFNRSEKMIDLGTLQLSDGGTPQALPAFLLYPDSFVVLTTSAGAAALAAFGPGVLAMTGFPSLNNDGDPLLLSDPTGHLIDQVTYSINWHQQTNKRDGGWSLERINPGTPCLGGENWQSCPVPPGGTPGSANASLSNLPDIQSPRLLAAFPENATTVRILFSEGLDQAAAANAAAFQLSPPRALAAALPSATDRREVLLVLSEPLEKGIIYRLTATAALKDCSGNALATSDTVFIGLPEIPASQDIVINEVLFNPATGGSDFVELYNRSDKIFSWQDFYLANFSSGSAIASIRLNRLFFPGEYAVFTADANDIQSRFAAVQAKHLYEIDLPSLADDSGNITLYWTKDNSSVTVDSFDYSEDYHNALLTASDRDGVALERIRPEGPTNEPANWTSAARPFTGAAGTPTLPNTQHAPAGNPDKDDLIQLHPARLSPDQDGFEDFLDIRYEVPSSGYAATLTIFDSDGIPVRRLVRQELIGTQGALRWDGESDDGTPARPGIYILFLELFNAEGIVKQVKKPFALVLRF